MTDYDVDLELKELQFSLQDELKEFTEKYYRDGEFRKRISENYWLSMWYWEYEECYELNHKKEWVISLDRDPRRTLEKMFFIIKNWIKITKENAEVLFLTNQ